MPTNIEWADETWNPIRARNLETGRIGWHCERVSPGCGQGGGICYAEQINKGFFRLGTKLPYTRPSRDKVEIFLDEEALHRPLHWKKPRKIFPCSMTDAFADFVPDEWLDKMLAIAALCPQHEFLFLTKRAERVFKYLSGWMTETGETKRSYRICERANIAPVNLNWPFPNVTLGFSAENQEWFDKRWPHMRTVAEAGWKVNCSYEPALGPIDFGPDLSMLSQVIFGGHSGPQAKPCDVQWARNTIAQCKAANTPVFCKQLGAVPGFVSGSLDRQGKPLASLTRIYLKDKKGGDPSEWFEDLRVREYPK